MARTSYTGYLRQYGSPAKSATPAVYPALIQFTFDPTQASAATGKILPVGAIPLYAVAINPGATGGVSPTVDIGTLADSDGFANELPADTGKGQLSTDGVLLGVPLTANTEIYAGVGASAATGGTVLAAIWYAMEDDGSQS